MVMRLVLSAALFLLTSAPLFAQQEVKPSTASAKDINQGPLFAKITLPWNNSMVRATVPVFGFAGGSSFRDYRLEYGEGRDPKAWIPIASGTKPFNEDPWSEGRVKWNPHSGASGTLGNWSTGLTSYAYQHWKNNLLGEYTLRLVVEGKDGAAVEDRVHVVVAEVLSRVMGGDTRSPDGRLHISVGKGSVSSTFVLVSMLPSSEPKSDPKLKIIGSPYEFQPPGIEFIKPATLTASYADADLDTNGDGRPDIAPEKLGLYFFRPVEEVWQRMPSRVSAASRTVVAEMTGSTSYLAYIALMADTTPPEAPEFSPITREIAGYTAAFSGKAEPGCSVEILLDGQRAASCQADDSGKFATVRLRLATGAHEISARAVDSAGNVSSSSERITFTAAPKPPKSVVSVRWVGSTEARSGEQLTIELTGQDASSRVDHALVSVTSETDPKGIEVELTETGPETGIYTGRVTVSAESSAEGPAIKALRHKEKITAASTLEPSKRAELLFVDTTPPSIPRIECAAYPVFLLKTFEEEDTRKVVEGWSTVEGCFGAALSLGEDQGNRFLKLTRQKTQSHMGAVALEIPYETRDWPLVAFDCMIPEGMKVDLLVSARNLGTFTARLTGDEKPFYPQIGTAFGVRADARWSHVILNLHSMLLSRFPGRTSFQIERLQFGNWVDRGFLRQERGANGPAGGWMGVDNFAVFAHRDVPAVTCTWASEDASGVAGYSVVFDHTPNTVPPEEARMVPAGAFAMAEPGVYYLHVRSADRCGNWGRTAHYVFLSDREPPSIGKMSVSMKDGRQFIQVPIRDSGLGLDLGSISLTVGGRAYGWASGALSYAPDTGTLTFDPWAVHVPAMPARGEKVAVTIAAADVVGRATEKTALGEYVAESPLCVSPPNPDGANGFYLRSPEISYEPVAGEKAFFEWQVKAPEDEFSRRGQGLNQLHLTIKYPDGRSRSFLKDFKLDTTVPKTAALTGVAGQEKPFTGGILPPRTQIALRHDDRALKVGAVECQLYSDAEFKNQTAVVSTDDFDVDLDVLGPDAKVLSAAWDGALRASAAGDTVLRLTRLDPFGECQVLVDGEAVATKPREKAQEEIECRVFLTKGWHRLEIRERFKMPMQRAPAVFWMPPGRSQSEIVPPASLGTYVPLATTRFQWDGGPWQAYAGPTTPLPGAHRLSFFSEDLAGHKEQTTTLDLISP